MKKKNQSLVASVMIFLMLCAALSCEEPQKVNPSNLGYTITSQIDPKVQAEILSMIEGVEGSTIGRIECCANPLPIGYDYNNLQQVTITGTSWVTYVAYSTTPMYNSEVNKHMVGIYYQNGVMMNWSETTWFNNRFQDTYEYTYHLPSISSQNYQRYLLYGDSWGNRNPPYSGRRVRHPSECGDDVAWCIQNWYGGSGWISVGLTFGTLFAPEIGVGVIGGCMLSCALGYT